MNHQYDLEDLAVLLACACDNLLLIHTGIEYRSMDERSILNVIFAAYANLRWLAEQIQNEIDKLPHELVSKAGGKA